MKRQMGSSLMRDCFSPADAFIALMLFCMEWSAVSRSSVVKSCFACKKRNASAYRCKLAVLAFVLYAPLLRLL